ncbi:MAG: TGS domain-containing protein [Candidatus Aenigmarchaeota archaeon]|nr:TGS domain-containing protein [Candidatus Aenigmarchaeota archaeon]
MPVNASIEYYKAEEDYKSAKTREEKIRCLEEMIRLLPKHKSSEHVLAELKKRLAKLKSQKEAKTGRSAFTFKKEGVGTVCLIGMPNSGKSTLLKKITGVDIEISDYPYTTTKPEIGMLKFEDVRIQIVEIPSTFDSEWMSIAHNSDLVIRVIDGNENLTSQRVEISEILKKNRIKIKTIKIIGKRPVDIEKLKMEIWKNLGRIRVYTKTQNKPPEKTPIVLKRGSTIYDVVKQVHKEFLKHFRFARIWGKSVKFPGATVGLDYKLEDKDIVQIFS